MYRYTTLLAIVSILSIFNPALANETAPWGHASTSETTYQKQKVVYDLDVGSKEHLANILARTAYLSKLNGDDPFDNKIIVVIHGDAIPFFAIKHTKQYLDLMKQAYSQTLGGSIEFRMCQAAARLQGFEAKDIHGFISMVPMADAEIIRLQMAGYAYMH
jgi:intracellular sulfur oxidation DsrE/DsrF family protein